MGILKKLLPHLVAIVVFAVVTLAYFSPLLEGKKLEQGDILQANGSAQEIVEFRERTGEEALWTNAVFGGMPAYQISIQYHNNILGYINRVFTLGLPLPAYMIFVAMACFYIMLLCFGVNPWLSIAGAFAYGFSTYFLIIIGAGHNTKMRALGYMPLVIGGIYMAYHQRKLWLGVLLTCIALGLQIRANHLQITYYTAIIILIYLILELVNIIRDRKYDSFVKTSAAMIIALVLAVSVNFTNMLLTAEYTPYSTRGPSELTDNENSQTGGLDKDYILNDYSYGIVETMNLFIPNVMGGASGGDAGVKSPYYDALVKLGYSKSDAGKYSKYAPLYWGNQRFTAGPVYIGAVVVFLFVLGLFVVKGRIKWWLVSATVLSVLLAWGKNFYMFSDLFIDYFPMYNKFRTVSMILIIATLCMPLLGILGLKEMFGTDLTVRDKQRALKNSFFITGGIALFFVVFPGLFFSFETPADLTREYPETLIAALRDTREMLLRNDSFRSLLFVTAAATILWFVMKEKLKVMAACVLFGALILADLWMVDKRYLNNNSFKKVKTANTIQPSPADLAILEDKSLDYRVLNLAADPFNDATTSFFHKSVGGYHGAKMKRYQELIERRLSPEMSMILSRFRSAKTVEDIGKAFTGCTSLNMLNTRYLIYDRQQVPLSNPDALGNAWPVSAIKWVENADAEIEALNHFDPGREAVIDERYRPVIGDFHASSDSTASIRLTDYEPNHLIYEYQSRKPQLVVFSEIFYDKGWNAYIDGELTPHIRANYVLRAMEVPAGKHEIVFRFEPEGYALGEKISLAGTAGIVLLILGVIAKEIYCGRKRQLTVES
jgi:hypothetical protein